MKIASIEDNQADFVRIKDVIKTYFPMSDFVHYTYLADFINADNCYDLIITDLRLPDQYGPEVVKQIRKLTGKPIIVLTGVGGTELPEKILISMRQAGATIFLSKHKNGFESLPEAIKSFL
jgi:DNA-binding NarL/FixJ family response regulator